MKNLVKPLAILSIMVFMSLKCFAIYDKQVATYYNKFKDINYYIYLSTEGQKVVTIDVSITSYYSNCKTSLRIEPFKVTAFKQQLKEIRDTFEIWSQRANNNKVSNVTMSLNKEIPCWVSWFIGDKLCSVPNAKLHPKFYVDSKGIPYVRFDDSIYWSDMYGFTKTSNILRWTFLNIEDFDNLIKALDLDAILKSLNQESLFGGQKYYYSTETIIQKPMTREERRKRRSEAIRKSGERWRNSANKALVR